MARLRAPFSGLMGQVQVRRKRLAFSVRDLKGSHSHSETSYTVTTTRREASLSGSTITIHGPAALQRRSFARRMTPRIQHPNVARQKVRNQGAPGEIVEAHRGDRRPHASLIRANRRACLGSDGRPGSTTPSPSPRRCVTSAIRRCQSAASVHVNVTLREARYSGRTQLPRELPRGGPSGV